MTFGNNKTMQDDRPKHRVTTAVSFIFGLLFAGALYAGGAPKRYWVITLIGVVVILGGRAILTELGIRRHQIMKNNKDSATLLPGLALLGLLLTGVIGIWHTFDSDGALGLIAAAISFGVVAVVSFM